MTYNKSNIVGVEFTVKGDPEKISYKILRQNTKHTVVLGWVVRSTKSEVSAGVKDVVKFLNNGTWIVKNSKV